MDNEKFQIYRDFCSLSKWFTVDVDLVANKLTTDNNFDLNYFIRKARSLGNVGCQNGKAFDLVITRPDEGTLRFLTNHELAALYLKAIIGEPLYRATINVSYRYDRKEREEEEKNNKKGQKIYSDACNWFEKNLEGSVIEHPYLSCYDRDRIILETIWTTQNEEAIRKLKQRFRKRVDTFNEKVNGSKPSWQIYSDCTMSFNIIDLRDEIKNPKER